MPRPDRHRTVKKTNRAQASKRRSVKKTSKVRAQTKAWSKKEDRALEQLVAAAPEEDINKWKVIARGMRGRNGKQCRERWSNHLRPGIKKGDWTIVEDRAITTMQKKIGNKWTRIATYLPGRTDNDVKNRWHSFMRSLKKHDKPTVDPLLEMGGKKLTTSANNIVVNVRQGMGMAAKKNIATKSIIYATPVKKLPQMHNMKYPVSSPSMRCFLKSPDSALAASTLSAMKQGLFSPFDKSTHINMNQGASHLGRPNNKNWAPQPVPLLSCTRNSVRAIDIFSPSYYAVSMAIATPTPAIPLATISSCRSGPFIPNTPMFKENTIHSNNVDAKGALSLDNGDNEEGFSANIGMTPLPFRYDASPDFTLGTLSSHTDTV